MELETSNTPFEPLDDRRRKFPEPPPVRLTSVADCVLPAVAGMEKELDQFYVGVIKFERDVESEGIVYRAENFRLRFEIFERPEPREDFIPLGMAIPNLAELIMRLQEMDIEYTRQRGVMPGLDNILIKDPAGNVLEISEFGISLAL